jgi:hypothetical protein
MKADFARFGAMVLDYYGRRRVGPTLFYVVVCLSLMYINIVYVIQVKMSCAYTPYAMDYSG